MSRVPLRVDASVIDVADNGARAHRDLVAHGRRFERRLHPVRPGVWCHVGGGMANITFLEGPGGVVMVDSGESVEEAGLALSALRERTTSPVVAVVYSHFHYVNGTRAVLDGRPDGDVEVIAHERVVANRTSFLAETGPMAVLGSVSQMGTALPTSGPDAMPNLGLGPFWRNPDLPTRTDGFVAPTRTVSRPTELEVAGLRLVLTPHASDSDDTLVIWVPDLAVCVTNHVWPAFYNVYPLRGEPYRDPVELLAAFDLILSYRPEHLVGVHGPPVLGADAVRRAVIDYRDAVQFIWDQTVRGMNRGRTADELVELVELPDRFRRSDLTGEFYGMVPHHVRQIHNGIRGWFDGDPTRLFPVPPRVEAARMVEGFGGRERLLDRARTALDDGEARWSMQLIRHLLILDPADTGARELAARALRLLAQTITGANARAYCLTRARELEGHLDLDRYRIPVTSLTRVLDAPPETYVHALRVQLVPERAAGRHLLVRWDFDDDRARSTALRLRDGVAVPEPAGENADVSLRLSHRTWAELYCGQRRLADAIERGDLVVIGRLEDLHTFLDCFEHPHLGRPDDG